MKNFIFIDEKTFEKARNEIKKHKGKTVVFSSNDDELNRKILEKEQINVFLPQLIGRKDYQKQRNSGLDSVMAKLAKKNNIIVGINLTEVLNSRGKEKSEILARIRQNVNLCKKNKVKMMFVGNQKDTYDLKAFGLVLGMPTWMTKDL
jgi:ribonuclease P/MRP protein subunit RPP1